MAKCTETCPRCGAGPTQFESQNSWKCGSCSMYVPGLNPFWAIAESEHCQARQQLAAANAEIERLRSLESAVVGDTLIAQVLSEPHAGHDDKCCDWCEAREDGIDKYQTRLLEIAFGKDHPRKETPHV